MPSKSPEQARLMRAVAHGWKKPGGGGPSRAVAREFVEADMRKGIPNHKQPMKPTPKVSTGGTVSAAVGSNPEYRHDEVKKEKNPQTRGMKKPEKGATPKRITTKNPPGGAYTPGAKKQRSYAKAMRSGY